MRVLIQDPNSQKFLSRDGDWNTIPANAEDFGTPLSAIAAAKAATNRDFRLVLYFPGENGSPGLLVGAGSANSHGVAPHGAEKPANWRES